MLNLNLISLVFPVLLITFVLWRFPVKPSLYIADTASAETEGGGMPSGKAELSFRAKILYWTVSVGCGVAIGACQLLLIRLDLDHAPDLLFESRMVYSTAYPFFPGLVLGLFCGMVLCFHVARRRGTSHLVGLLRMSWNRIPLYKYYSWAKGIGIMLGLSAFVFNFVAYNTFLLVSEHDIKYRRWRSSVVHKSISGLQEIRAHETSIGRGDTATDRFYVELVFKDGSSIKTRFIVPAQRSKELIESIQVASGGAIPIIKGNHPSKSSSN